MDAIQFSHRLLVMTHPFVEDKCLFQSLCYSLCFIRKSINLCTCKRWFTQASEKAHGRILFPRGALMSPPYEGLLILDWRQSGSDHGLKATRELLSIMRWDHSAVSGKNRAEGLQGWHNTNISLADINNSMIINSNSFNTRQMN